MNVVLFRQLSESPASVPLCPPAETAEINQYDLADALIDTEKSHQEESLDAGCLSHQHHTELHSLTSLHGCHKVYFCVLPTRSYSTCAIGYWLMHNVTVALLVDSKSCFFLFTQVHPPYQGPRLYPSTCFPARGRKAALPCCMWRSLSWKSPWQRRFRLT